MVVMLMKMNAGGAEVTLIVWLSVFQQHADNHHCCCCRVHVWSWSSLLLSPLSEVSPSLPSQSSSWLGTGHVSSCVCSSSVLDRMSV